MKQEGALGWCSGRVQTGAYLDPLTTPPQQPHTQALLEGSARNSTLAILVDILHFALFLTLGSLSLVFEQAF